jgi:hypothetical protein
MLKTKLLFITSLLISYYIAGQECGTPTKDPNKVNIYSQKSDNSFKNQQSGVCINVQFHIIRETNGGNAFTATNTNDLIQDLNEAFNSHDIYFNNIGTNFIDNSSFVNIDNANEAEDLVGVKTIKMH